jgi:hypothetical protein
MAVDYSKLLAPKGAGYSQANVVNWSYYNTPIDSKHPMKYRLVGCC